MLVLHLKRFEGLAGKIARHVAFPESLSLASFTAEGSPECERVAQVRRETLEKLREERMRAEAAVEAAAAAAAAAVAREVERQERSNRRFMGSRGSWQGGRGGRGSPFGQGRGRGPAGLPISLNGVGNKGLLGPGPRDLTAAPPTPPGSYGTPGRGAVTPTSAAAAAATTAATTVATAAASAAASAAEEEIRAADEAADEAAAAQMSQREQPQYVLTGVLVHQGVTVASGHYYAFVKDGAGTPKKTLLMLQHFSRVVAIVPLPE